MSDLKLSDGREVTIDLYKVTQNEIRDWLWNPLVEDEVADEYMERVTGLQDVGDLLAPDYALITNTVIVRYRNPISDPNSSSESSSTTKKGTKSQTD
jgi:hypothetical protein